MAFHEVDIGQTFRNSPVFILSQFVTVNPSESADVIMETLVHKSSWALHPPKLLICILGGEEADAPMAPSVERAICKDLVETVLSTGECQSSFTRVTCRKYLL